MGRNRLKEGQKTVIVGVRLPSSLEYEINRHVRRLSDQGHKTNKSEIIRAVIEKNMTILDRIFIDQQRGFPCQSDLEQLKDTSAPTLLQGKNGA